MLGKTDATMFQGEAHHLLPGVAAEKLASHALDFWLTSEDLPDPDNRVLLDRDGGIRLHYRPNNLGPHEIADAQAAASAEPYRLRAAPAAAERLFVGKRCRSPAPATRTARSVSGMTRATRRST